MNEQFIEMLEERGLRLASENESGWYVRFINNDGESISLWVTDVEWS